MDIDILREWAPLTDLFNCLPTKLQNGLFSNDLKITCIDSLPDFLALGTNFGIIYWYDRKNRDIKPLHTENVKSSITALRITSTVDYMVACGQNNGAINIFQIPKTHPDTIPENLRPKMKQIERYTVSDLHRTPVTALEWSKNGMKLFSGDKTGCIVLTEIDFYMHICKSCEIINESYQVVQLSYRNQRLLVSTTYRSIICYWDTKWKVSQVGRKDRKVLGNFGGIIHQSGLKSTDSVLYCIRPGLRIWIADMDGAVQKTILFKDLLSKECPEISVINPISYATKMLKPQKEASFGMVLPFSNNLLVTHNNDVLYVLDPIRTIVIAVLSQLRNILGVSTCKDEIFVLEGERSLIRIAFKPESNMTNQSLNSLATSSTTTASLSIKDLTHRLQTTNIVAALPPFIDASDELDVHTDETLVMHAEEARESPVIKRFNDIGRREFTDRILHKHNRTKKGRKDEMSTSTGSLNSNGSLDESTYHGQMCFSAIGLLPDLRSPQSIQNDIEYKEKILASVLDLNKFKIDMNKLQLNDEEKKMDDHLEKNHYNQSPIRIEPPPPPPPKVDVIKETTPVCLNIPNDWKLSDIKVNGTGNETSLSDTSLNDWELI